MNCFMTLYQPKMVVFDVLGMSQQISYLSGAFTALTNPLSLIAVELYKYDMKFSRFAQKCLS